jgi:chromate reductase, NAD(P)H dehydrogenase (quinone)
MAVSRNVSVIVGSLRKESLNRKVAVALAEIAPKQLKLNIVEIRELPLYNQDLDVDPPKTWMDFRQQIASSDAVLFVTPEYNRSVPAPLKNAIDVGSRPYGQSVWNGKPGAVISVTPSALGGFGANHHLRQSLVFLNVPMLQQPEAYIGNVDKLLDADGRVIGESTNDFLFQFMLAFENWIAINSSTQELTFPTHNSTSPKNLRQ